MDQIKTTKDHHYQQLANKDVLFITFVPLDTSHLLMSALNAAAFKKAVVVGRRKKKGSDVKWTIYNNKGPPLSLICKVRLTAIQGRHT
jgi:hypothetical protein